MNRLVYDFYEGRLFGHLLALTGRVRAGALVGWGHWMTRAQVRRCVGTGWRGLVDTCFTACLETGTRVEQVKEKYGGLRFYVGDAPEWVHMRIDCAEIASRMTCEECGRLGKLRPTGWYKTLCDECNKPEERQRRRERSWQ